MPLKLGSRHLKPCNHRPSSFSKLEISHKGKIQKCEDSPRSFGRGGREGWRAAPRHEVSLRRKGQQKPAAWTFGRGGTQGCAPSIQEIQKFEFFWVRGRLLRGSCWGGGRSRARSSASERRSCQREPWKARRFRLRMKAVLKDRILQQDHLWLRAQRGQDVGGHEWPCRPGKMLR